MPGAVMDDPNEPEDQAEPQGDPNAKPPGEEGEGDG